MDNQSSKHVYAVLMILPTFKVLGTRVATRWAFHLKIPTNPGRSTTARVEQNSLSPGGDPLKSHLLDAAGGARETREPALPVHPARRAAHFPTLARARPIARTHAMLQNAALHMFMLHGQLPPQRQHLTFTHVHTWQARVRDGHSHS